MLQQELRWSSQCPKVTYTHTHTHTHTHKFTDSFPHHCFLCQNFENSEKCCHNEPKVMPSPCLSVPTNSPKLHMITNTFTHQKSTARCVYCLKPFWCCLPGQRQSLCGGSRWLPCSCHCLSTRKRLPPFSSAHIKFRLRRVFLRQATVSARATVYPAKHRLPPAKI